MSEWMCVIVLKDETQEGMFSFSKFLSSQILWILFCCSITSVISSYKSQLNFSFKHY